MPMASKFPVVSGVGGRALNVGMGTPGVSNEVPGNNTVVPIGAPVGGRPQIWSCWPIEASTAGLRSTR